MQGTTYAEHPGMTTIAPLPNNKWIMTFEYGGASPSFGVFYKIFSSPLAFDSVSPLVILLSAGGTVPTSSPYVVQSLAWGANGTIVVSANSNTQIFVNTKLGDPNSWVEYSTPQSGAYSRHLRVMDNPDWLLILSAGYWAVTTMLRTL
jgi:hypothetical protein